MSTPSVSTVQTENAAAVCVVPIYSTMGASGTAAIETLQQVNVNMQYDISFGHTLSEADAAAIANGFVVAGGADVFEVDMSGGAAAGFSAALENAVDVAEDASGLTLQKYLYNDALSVLKDVWSDALANVLQSNWDLSVTVDSATGASNMQSDLADADVKIRRAIAAQLPESNFYLYADASENPTVSALPLKQGDTIVFLFDTTTNLISRIPAKVQNAAVAAAQGSSTVADGTAADAPAGSTATATGSAVATTGTAVDPTPATSGQAVGGDPYGTGLIQQYSGRKDVVAFFLTVGATTGVNGKINGLTAASGNPANLIASGNTAPQGY
jgi:hypothetical protein